MPTDFKNALSRQLSYLASSCAAFDTGQADEAIRVATALRTLFHNTRSSTSLLSHLRATDVRLLSTSLDIAAKMNDPWLRGARLQMFNGMGQFSLGESPAYRPSLGSSYTRRLLSLSNWWREIVFVLDANTTLARSAIVLAAANKDGGAHVDASLPPEYERLIHSADLGSWKSENGELTTIGGHHYVALRQMGYEALNSPELTGLAVTQKTER